MEELNKEVKENNEPGSKIMSFFRKPTVKILAVIGSVLVTFGLLEVSKDKDVYTVKVTSDDPMDLYDEDGNVIKEYGKEKKFKLIFEDEDVDKNGEKRPVIVVEDDGEMIEGFVENKFLDMKTKEKLRKVESDKFSQVSVVSAKSGAWVRQNKIIDRNTEDAKLLKPGTYVIATDIGETSSDNRYFWKEIIYLDGEEFKTGYIAEDYLLDVDFDKLEGRKFVVCTEDSDLNLRTHPLGDSESKVITGIPKGSEVVVILNNEEISTENHDWLYVAYKDEETGEILLGWVAAREKSKEPLKDTIYLKEKTEEIVVDEKKETEEKKSKVAKKIVDTDKDGKIDLNLRSNPSTEGKIITEIENGTVVYVIGSDKIIDQNDREWIKIKLESGETGYVASEYLRNPKKNIKIVNTDKDGKIDLNLRDKPTTEGKILKKIANNTTVTIEEGEEIIIDENGRQWVKIELSSEVKGYVCVEYLKDKEEKKDKKNKKNKEYNCITREIFAGEMVEGYMGIDLNAGNVDSACLDTYLKGKCDFPTDTPLKECGDTPNFVYMKLGATGWGNNFNFVDVDIEKINELTLVCEDNKVPYGFYYYIQSTTEEEAKKEIEHIIELYNNVNSSEYHLLPLAIDIERGGPNDCDGRMVKYVERTEDGKFKITKVHNYIINTLREKLGVDVIIYTDKNSMEEIVNFEEFDSKNKENIWTVSPSLAHATYIKNNPNVRKAIGIRQVELDIMVNSGKIDIDFMNKEMFEKIIERVKVKEEKANNIKTTEHEAR